MRRKRKCGECNKPLGSTAAYCHEHGGESIDRPMTDIWGVQWKIDLGVDPALIFEQHDKSVWDDR